MPLPPLGAPSMVNEAAIRDLIHQHPFCLPIAEIDPLFVNPVAVCTELRTNAGSIDNLLITPSGLPVIVECKLWRNPEGRCQVVGQILDYAKELSRWSSADLQRSVRQRLRQAGDPLLDLVRQADPSVDEIAFGDALTTNLRRGRFLLLIVGDGIREGVEAIAEYLQAHAGLHFSLGLVEMPLYSMQDGTRLIVPRVLARTLVVTRKVVKLPEGMRLSDADEEAFEPASAELDFDPDRTSLLEKRERFWRDFLEPLRLDDPEQSLPKPSRQGYVKFMLPVPGGTCWLTAYRNIARDEVGIMLSSQRSGAGEIARQAILDDWDVWKAEMNGTANIELVDGRETIIDRFSPGPTEQPEGRAMALAWLRERVNTFINVVRPRIRSAVADYNASGPAR